MIRSRRRDRQNRRLDIGQLELWVARCISAVTGLPFDSANLSGGSLSAVALQVAVARSATTPRASACAPSLSGPLCEPASFVLPFRYWSPACATACCLVLYSILCVSCTAALTRRDPTETRPPSCYVTPCERHAPLPSNCCSRSSCSRRHTHTSSPHQPWPLYQSRHSTRMPSYVPPPAGRSFAPPRVPPFLLV